MKEIILLGALAVLYKIGGRLFEAGSFLRRTYAASGVFV